MNRKTTVLLLLCAMTVFLPKAARSMELSASASVQARMGSIGFSHDASSTNPLFGDPTSELEYDRLSETLLSLRLEGKSEPAGAWFDLTATIGLTSGGSFRDADFYRGQVLFSETLSKGLSADEYGLNLRFSGDNWVWGDYSGFVLRPYLAGGIRQRRLSARGLRCGDICGALPSVAAGREVIGQNVLDFYAGPGLWLEKELSPRQRIDLKGEIGLGYRHVADSHRLRPDLGPTPNIEYDFALVRAHAELNYVHAITDKAGLTIGMFGGGALGRGHVTYAALTDTPFRSLPARTWEWNVGLSVGLDIDF